MKIYLVEANFGQYEDNYNIPLGCYANKNMAEAARTLYEEQVKNAMLVSPPFVTDANSWEEADALRGDEAVQYEQWERDYNLGQNFNFCSIIEHEVIP